jgi:hypothetical protein
MMPVLTMEEIAVGLAEDVSASEGNGGERIDR